MFIAFVYVFRASYVPIIRRKYRTYATPGICHSIWTTLWYAGRNEIPPCIPDSHLHRVTNTRCRIGTVFSPDDGHIVCPKHVDKSNKHIKKICAPSWFYLQKVCLYLLVVCLTFWRRNYFFFNFSTICI